MFQGRRPKKRTLFPQKWPKNANLGLKKHCFSCSGGHFKPRNPLFCRGLTYKHCVAGYGSQKIGVAGPLQPAKGHYVSDSGLKLPMLCKKSAWFRLGGSVHGPSTLFCRCRIHQNRSHSIVGMRSKLKSNSPRHSVNFSNKPTLLPLKAYVTSCGFAFCTLKIGGGSLNCWCESEEKLVFCSRMPIFGPLLMNIGKH